MNKVYKPNVYTVEIDMSGSDSRVHEITICRITKMEEVWRILTAQYSGLIASNLDIRVKVQLLQLEELIHLINHVA